MNTARSTHSFLVAAGPLKGWTYCSLGWTSDFSCHYTKSVEDIELGINEFTNFIYPQTELIKMFSSNLQGSSLLEMLSSAKGNWMSVATGVLLPDLAVPLWCDLCWAVSTTPSHKQDLVLCVGTGTLRPEARLMAAQLFGHISPKISDSSLLNPVSVCVTAAQLGIASASPLLPTLLPSPAKQLWGSEPKTFRAGDSPARLPGPWCCAIWKDKSLAAQDREKEVLWKAGLS